MADDRTLALEGLLRMVLARENEWAATKGVSDCSCMFLSRDTEREYEGGTCPHQLAVAALNHTE